MSSYNRAIVAGNLPRSWRGSPNTGTKGEGMKCIACKDKEPDKAYYRGAKTTKLCRVCRYELLFLTTIYGEELAVRVRNLKRIPLKELRPMILKANHFRFLEE